MTWIIILAIGFAIGWWINSKRVEDHTGDPDALPCPVCRTASPAKTLGYHVCPQCSSRWLPSGSWVIRFRCRCGAAPVKITQDPYNPQLFGIKFSCGRVGNYNSETQAKHDREPCGEDIRQKISETEQFDTPTKEVVESAPTKVNPSKVDPKGPDGPPAWVHENDDYPEETEVIVD